MDFEADDGPPMAARLDPESAAWVRSLQRDAAEREAALGRLHARLLPIARAEVSRRQSRLSIGGPELDDIAHQAAADALVAITRKLSDLRGESRFTTWAYRFVIFEVSTKLGRHFWRYPAAPMDALKRLGPYLRVDRVKDKRRAAVKLVLIGVRSSLASPLKSRGGIERPL